LKKQTKSCGSQVTKIEIKPSSMLGLSQDGLERADYGLNLFMISNQIHGIGKRAAPCWKRLQQVLIRGLQNVVTFGWQIPLPKNVRV
jgi:hypothetical protein